MKWQLSQFSWLSKASLSRECVHDFMHIHMAKFNVIQSHVIHKRSPIYRGVPEKQLMKVPYRITPNDLL